MLGLLLHWLVVAVGLLVVAHIVPGIAIANFQTALMAALVIGLINALIRPIVMFLALPINILTLGLFALVINALLLMLAAWLVPGFMVSGFFPAFLGSILLSVLTSLFGLVTGGWVRA